MEQSKYGKVFDKSCLHWTKNGGYNLIFLRYNEDYYNEILKAQGYVFLSDVYKSLGFDLTRSSVTDGWIYDAEKNTRVDFGISVTEGPDVRLNFNVEGNILHHFID